MTSTNERRQLEMELTDLIDAENLRGKDAALAYNNRGHLRYLQVNFDGAIEDYDKAIANDPDLAVAYYNRGTVFYRLGSNINSARWIGSVSKFFLLMNFSMTVFSLDFCMCDVGKFEDALTDMEQAVRLEAKNGEFAEGLTACLTKKNQVIAK
ncbi:uncharacterized protein LOC126235886 isoform X2 [Schistocerca nitens]|uniref:uncharacterized protein LOC126235886 isoform X2 n=1 Tax=Schistocerca nitens TaxID=7011 RepID=UPI00211943E0|nr:uncharacterized protein LOC126235886 isoform X2 [Schistocerca nitens]